MSDRPVKIHLLNKMANFFLVAREKDLTLIDTGNKDKIENIRAKFEKIGYDLADLKRIVLTHSHYDHTGSLATIKKATGAKVMAHEAEIPYISGKARISRPGGIGGFLFYITEPIFRSPPVEVDVSLKDNDTIEETGLRVIHTPGHTPGSICLYHAGEKALFTGDGILNRDGRLMGPIPFFSSDIVTARLSVDKVAELDVETVYFCHGPTMRNVPEGTLKSLASSLKKKVEA